MPSIFAKIVAGEIPCYKVAENDEFLAFLDIFPLAKGHSLVIPKLETDYIFDIESDAYSRLWLFAKKVAQAQKKVISCERIGVAVIGLEVPHAHIHLVPINGVNDIDFSKPKLSFSKQEMNQIAIDISKVF
ncbi:MAG: HIT family protein [Flavobacteriales bacterium]|nr:HIT family protein [Flavobacteriales bacterium]|tara:strand:+ start:446 stop:838 length:393 start_codon:yes stop_codon:yes gene_type:complete